MVSNSRGFHLPMAFRKQGQLGDVAVDKEKIDSDYWRNKYDELLKHLEHQNQYLRYLEREVFGGNVF